MLFADLTAAALHWVMLAQLSVQLKYFERSIF